jgi:hypothetical protein
MSEVNTPCWGAGGWTALVAWRGDRAPRESASQLNFFCEEMEAIARKGLPA